MKDKRKQFTFKFEGTEYWTGQNFENDYTLTFETDYPHEFWTNGKRYHSREEVLEAIKDIILNYPNRMLAEAQEEGELYSAEDYQSDVEYAQAVVKKLYKQAEEWLAEPEY